MAKHSISKNPEEYTPEVKDAGDKRIVGLDLGTNCGVAFVDLSCPYMILGQWDLSVGPYDTGPLRHIRLKHFLSILKPDLIMFEDVKFAGGKDTHKPGGSIHAIVARVATSIEFLGGLKVTITTWAEERGLPSQGIGISAIKKYATGKGRANKVDMINACNERFRSNFDPDKYEEEGTDNMADAAFVCAMGVDLYSKGV